MGNLNTTSSAQVVLPENRSYHVRFDSISSLPFHLAELGVNFDHCLIVTDTNVGDLYQATLVRKLEGAGASVHSFRLPAGESSKSPELLALIYDFALSKGISRITPIIALGGGVVGDIAGFAAATLLRGLPLIHVPTSLVAQVDSSIGGKTGYNHSAGKNLIGAFYQPLLVLSDADTLVTLPDREWTSGMAEAIKHSLIYDDRFFSWIEDNLDAILRREASVVASFVAQAASIKCNVVSKDEKESGLRMILNFGHTFGHALERSLGYGNITHGEAVAIGMRAALFLSSTRDVHEIDRIELGRIDRVLSSIPVPDIPESVSIDALCASMNTDKKRTTASLRFVLLRRLGQAYTTIDVPNEHVRAAWQTALDR
jgi:3-dehydroquinate synthase